MNFFLKNKKIKGDASFRSFFRKTKGNFSSIIVFAKNFQTIGVGAGQMSRVISTEIAAMKAKEFNLEANGAAMASDAFFPFRDGIDQAASVGIKTIIQPGGSMRDDEVIEACDEHGISMVFVGVRHFKH